MNKSNSLILALPKGRVYEDFTPLLEKTQFAIKDDVKKSRKMLLDTKHPSVKVLIIRGWDVPTYITSGAAHMGIVGKDEHHKNLMNCLCDEKKIDFKVIESGSRPTSVKTRIIADNRQLARIDNEVTDEISDKDVSSFIDIIDKNIKNIDGVIIQDYNKGLLTSSLIKYIIDCSNKNEVSVYVDPKFNNYSSYKGVRLFKPNLVEYTAIAKEEEFGPLPESGFNFKDYMNSEILLLTLGSSGMSLYHDGTHESIPTQARQVFDVSGAGDTVIATFALNDLCGLKPLESAMISNLAAGRVCEDVGVSPITIDSLNDFFSHHYNLDL